MTIRLTYVDTFTVAPFAGNPAAVCVLPSPGDDDWMQLVARETNLPATAFLSQEAELLRLRWFSPTTELALCGHGTLASAHVLSELRRLRPGMSIAFVTCGGTLHASVRDHQIELNFPAEPALAVPPPAGLIEALGVHPLFVGRNRFDYLVQVQSEAVVRELMPDIRALGAIDTRGVIVTASADTDPYDFVSRFFAPRAGAAEDPVTGSAHCCLGPFWQERLGRAELTGYQASARGGTVRVRLEGDRAYLSGDAVTVLHAELVAPFKGAPSQLKTEAMHA